MQSVNETVETCLRREYADVPQPYKENQFNKWIVHVKNDSQPLVNPYWRVCGGEDKTAKNI